MLVEGLIPGRHFLKRCGQSIEYEKPGNRTLKDLEAQLVRIYESFFTGMALKRLSWLLATAALVVLAAPGLAQSTASISGTVRDPTGALVPGARVTLTNQANKAIWSVKSNGEGFFVFAAVPPATYSLHVTRQGFESWDVTGIVVHPGDSVTVPKISLQVGRADVSVTVTAATAGVTLDSPEHSTLITSSEIDRLATEGRGVHALDRVHELGESVLHVVGVVREDPSPVDAGQRLLG